MRWSPAICAKELQQVIRAIDERFAGFVDKPRAAAP